MTRNIRTMILGGALATMLALPLSALAQTPSIQIHYSPNGGGAAKTYEGVRNYDMWQNDKFDNTRWGTNGLGQKIRWNAASVRLQPNTAVEIYANAMCPYFQDSLCGGGAAVGCSENSSKSSLVVNFADFDPKPRLTNNASWPYSIRNRNWKFRVQRADTYKCATSGAYFGRLVHRRTGLPLTVGFCNPSDPCY